MQIINAQARPHHRRTFPSWTAYGASTQRPPYCVSAHASTCWAPSGKQLRQNSSLRWRRRGWGSSWRTWWRWRWWRRRRRMRIRRSPGSSGWLTTSSIARPSPRRGIILFRWWRVRTKEGGLLISWSQSEEKNTSRFVLFSFFHAESSTSLLRELVKLLSKTYKTVYFDFQVMKIYSRSSVKCLLYTNIDFSMNFSETLLYCWNQIPGWGWSKNLMLSSASLKKNLNSGQNLHSSKSELKISNVPFESAVCPCVPLQLYACHDAVPDWPFMHNYTKPIDLFWLVAKKVTTQVGVSFTDFVA